MDARGVTIGFIGLGRMGGVMAPRLATAGFDVVAWNRTPGKAIPGVRVVERPDEVVAAADTILMMTDAAGSVAVSEALPALDGRLVVFLGTHAPEMIERLAGLIESIGGHAVESPVLGTAGPAAEGKLVALVGGLATHVDAVRPVLAVLARKTVHTGAIGTATAMKFAHNMMLTGYWALLGEAMAMGEAAGLASAALIDVLIDSPAANGALALKRPYLLGEELPIGFSLATASEEFSKIVAFAARSGRSLPVAEHIAARVREIADGLATDVDVAVIAPASSKSLSTLTI